MKIVFDVPCLIMWSEIVTILPLLIALPCDGTRLSVQGNRIKEPMLDDTQVFDELADLPAEDESSAGNDGASNDGPPVENYMKLRQRNAEMSTQVEKLAHEAHVLKHRLKVTKLQEKFAREKIAKKCPTGTQRQTTANRHLQIKMPWSLTHTATRHMQKKGTWFPGEDTIRGLFDHFKTMGDQFVLERTPRSYATAGTVGQLHRDVVELNREVKQTHVRLGRVQEVKVNLDEHYQALRAKVAAMEESAARDQQQLNTLAADENVLDQKLAQARQSQSATIAQVSEADQETKVKEETDKLHQVAQQRLHDASQEVNRLKKENDQLQANIDALTEKQPTEVTQLQNLQKSIEDGKDTATNLEKEKVKLREEADDFKQKAASYNDKLMDSSSKDEQCVEWTTKLEAKLKHVLAGKKDDATLCHSSILGLHKERVGWKDGIGKMHSEIKKLKRKAEEMQRKGDETLATLNSCLGRST